MRLRAPVLDERITDLISYYFNKYRLQQRCHSFPRWPGTWETDTDGKMFCSNDVTSKYSVPPGSFAIGLADTLFWLYGVAKDMDEDEQDPGCIEYLENETPQTIHMK